MHLFAYLVNQHLFFSQQDATWNLFRLISQWEACPQDLSKQLQPFLEEHSETDLVGPICLHFGNLAELSCYHVLYSSIFSYPITTLNVILKKSKMIRRWNSDSSQVRVVKWDQYIKCHFIAAA